MSASLRTRLIDGIAPGPSLDRIRRTMIDEALAELAARPRGDVIAALDAGCGHASPLRRYRHKLTTLTGMDLHVPGPGAMPYLDRFVAADLCRDGDALPEGSIDLVVSNFAFEHLADPGAALRNLEHWMRPGGHLVLTTVNRRHPFVGIYLRLPRRLRDRLQQLVRGADGHPLVGACNDPATVRLTLRDAGFEQLDVRTVGHLARAWRRHWPTMLLGLVGDLAAAPFPSRRSTIVAAARTPAT